MTFLQVLGLIFTVLFILPTIFAIFKGGIGFLIDKFFEILLFILEGIDKKIKKTHNK